MSAAPNIKDVAPRTEQPGGGAALSHSTHEMLSLIRDLSIIVSKRRGWVDDDAPSPLAGRCAAVALLVQRACGGEIIHGTVDGMPHYWNRLPGGREVDLTSCQFGGDGITPMAVGVPTTCDLVPIEHLMFAQHVLEELQGNEPLDGEPEPQWLRDRGVVATGEGVKEHDRCNGGSAEEAEAGPEAQYHRDRGRERSLDAGSGAAGRSHCSAHISRDGRVSDAARKISPTRLNPLVYTPSLAYKRGASKAPVAVLVTPTGSKAVRSPSMSNGTAKSRVRRAEKWTREELRQLRFLRRERRLSYLKIAKLIRTKTYKQIVAKAGQIRLHGQHPRWHQLPDFSTHCYLIQYLDDGTYKIGCTRNWNTRRGALKFYHGSTTKRGPARPFRVVQTAAGRTLVHSVYAEQRICGRLGREFFAELPPEILEWFQAHPSIHDRGLCALYQLCGDIGWIPDHRTSIHEAFTMLAKGGKSEIPSPCPAHYDELQLELYDRVRALDSGHHIFSVEVAPGSTRQSLNLPVQDEVAGRVVYFHEPVTCAGETSIEVEVERMGKPAAWEVPS